MQTSMIQLTTTSFNSIIGVAGFFGMYYLQIRRDIEDVQQNMLLIYNNVNDPKKKIIL
jgi:hypothetical protein